MIKSKQRSFLKWAGSKFHSVQTILSHLPPSRRLIEPFAGSAVVFLNTHYPDNILGEINADLINLYRCIKTEGEDFVHYCAQFFIVNHNCSESYYQFRNDFNTTQDTHYKSALFLYLNRHGYNGLCRYNQSGRYNVPFGSIQNPYFPRKELLFFHKKSQNTFFIHNDFQQTFSLAQAGDVIYCDPPYVPLSTTSNFTTYTDKKFTEQEQITLVQLALRGKQRGITTVISNHDTEFTRHHYREANIDSFNVRRYISCGERILTRELVAVFAPD